MLRGQHNFSAADQRGDPVYDQARCERPPRAHTLPESSCPRTV
jgi:hypothetical protein